MPDTIENRYNNADGGGDHCPLCCDDGAVVYGTERWLGADFDVAAPCPGCRRGFKAEFPETGIKPWGPLGFWRGRPFGMVKRTCEHIPNPRKAPPTPKERQAAHEAARSMLQALGVLSERMAAGPPPLPQPEPEEELTL